MNASAASHEPPRLTPRVRLVRPDCFSDETVGRLSHAAFRVYYGIAVQTDDDGYVVWRASKLAAWAMLYEAPANRRSRSSKAIRMQTDLSVREQMKPSRLGWSAI